MYTTRTRKKLFTTVLLLLVCALVLVFAPAAWAADEQDWEAMFEQEWRAMGYTAAPAILPAPGGNAPFPYSIITQETANRPDEDSMVLILMGDGFTSDPDQQAKWRYYCQYFARNFVNQKPFNEFKDKIKIFRIDVVSNASGITRSDSPDGRNMPDDPKDTYFGSRVWNSGMARLGGSSTVPGNVGATAMGNAYAPTNTSSNKTVLFNTSIYGGSGGSTSYAGLSWAFVDVTAHEIGHAAGNLPDEYLYSGMGQLTGPRGSYTSQLTVVHRNWIDDPAWQEWNPWYRLLGKNGTTFDPWLEGLTTDADFINLYRSIPNCKMRFVGSNDMLDLTGHVEFEFCEICQEKWRDQICLMSKNPVLHFQPYNDQFYNSVPVRLDNKNFILRIPVSAGSSLCQKVYGEEINSLNAVRNVLGEFKMTVYKDGVAIPQYTDVPATTPMNLAVGTYTVSATFVGTYNGEPYTLSLNSVANEFEVKEQTIITKVGKYAEPWNSEDKTDSLSREWRRDTAVMLPELGIDPTRVGGTDASQFDITYSWHVRNFDGSRGTQLGETGVYGGATVSGPSAVGQYMLAIHSKANATAPAAAAGYETTNEYPFDISTPFHAANHYTVQGGVYSHELVSNDFRGITIVGEGFTEAEQDKFEAVAEDFITKFLETDPVKRVSERFCFFIENTMSADSGLTREGGVQKDSYYGFRLNADGTLGTYRTDLPMDVVIFQDVWRRDTNTKTWAQWGTTVVLINEEEVQANYNWRHPEANRAAHLSTIADKDYKRLIESVVTQFAHVRSNRDMDLLDTYRWMEGPDQNKTFQETMERLIESCYSHEMYGSGILNLPRPVIVSDASTKLYISDGTQVVNWDVPETFKAYSFGHELVTNTVAADTFTYRYYTDNNHRVGDLLDEAPVQPGFYWAEADLPTGAKYYLKTETDRYGFTYAAGQQMPGVNGTGTANSARVRGFARFEIAPITYNYTVYLAPHITDLLVGDTFLMDVMLVGDTNYTRAEAAITYDSNLLEYVGYSDLAGWVGEVAKTENTVKVQSVPNMNLYIGGSCVNDVKIVTLKFTVKDNFTESSVDTDLGFASIVINPPLGTLGTIVAPGEDITITLRKYIEPAAADIARQFVVDDPHAIDFMSESVFVRKAYEPNTIMTNGVIDPLFAAGGVMVAPTNRSDKKMKVYVIAVDFNDCEGDVYIPYGLQRNVFTSTADGSLFDLSYPELAYTTVFFGSEGLKALDSSKFEWKGTLPVHEFKGLKQLVEEMSMGRFEVEVECLNERLAVESGLDPDTEKWPWFRVDGPMLEYSTQGPADCEDYRQFAKLHQAGIDAAYRDIPGLDIEDIDFIYTIVPYNTHGYRSGLQGGSGLDTSFSYNDQALLQRDSEYRHEPGVRTKSGRIVGSGVFGVKGVWSYSMNGFSAPNPMSATRVSLHEFTHGMGMIDDYSYGGMGTNTGESTASGVGSWGMMGSSMGSATPDLFAWRKFRMGWIDDEEIETVLPGQSKIINIRALGSYTGDGGDYTDDPDIKTRMVLIPKEFRTRDTFGAYWNNGWNPKKTDYDWYDWFTNPWLGGETNAIKSFPTFYALECRKALGADNTMGLVSTSGSAGVLVSYVANATWETGCGAGGFKLMTGNSGLRVGGTDVWRDNNIGLTVTVLESNVFYDKVLIDYTGNPGGTSAAKHVYLGMLNASDNFVTAGQAFTVDFDITTLGGPTINDATGTPANASKIGTPLAVPGGICGFTMSVEFDAANLEYVSAGTAPFTYIVDATNAAAGKLVVKGASRTMVDKDIILSLNFKAKVGAALGDYTVKGAISDVKLIDFGGRMLSAGSPGFDGVGTVGDGGFAAFHANTANTLASEDIKSNGGKVTVGTTATYTVSGQITCDTPGPAEGMFIGVESVVTVYNSNGVALGAGKSDWDGYYSIAGVPAGSDYYIKAEKPKYTSGQSNTFSVVNADVGVIDLRLNRTLYTVSGVIYGSDNSDGSGAVGLAGAQVYIVNTGDVCRILGGPVTTGPDGSYSIQARAEHKQYAAVAVVAEGYGSHIVLKDGAKTNLGTLFGRNPADAAFGTTTQLGAANIYNFTLDGDISGKDVILTKTQDVQLRVTPYSAETTYQLRNMDGSAVGAPVNSWGGMNTTRGDDVLRNVSPGKYYIEVSREGYISACTAPFIVSSTRAILRNNVGTNTMTMQAESSGNLLAGTVYDAVSGAVLSGVRVQSIPYSATYGAGVPIFTATDGTFSYLTVSAAKDLVFSKAGYESKTVYYAAGNQNDLVIELTPTGAPVTYTYDNLYAALQGETNATAAYLAFAAKAAEEGYPMIAQLFTATADAEAKHADDEWAILLSMGATVRPTAAAPTVGTTLENLLAAFDGETYEYTVMYPDFLATAQAEGETDAARIFNRANRAEEVHAGNFADVRSLLLAGDIAGINAKYAVVYRCVTCGEVVTTLPDPRCPICGADKETFAQYGTIVSDGITVKFDGVKNAQVQYYTNVSGWQTVGTFDDICNFAIPADHKATWGTTTVQVLKGGMWYTFSGLEIDDDPIVLDVPLATITLTNITAACNLGLAQEDWVYPSAAAVVGEQIEYLVFDNNKPYIAHLNIPGAPTVQIPNIAAGATLDLGPYF